MRNAIVILTLVIFASCEKIGMNNKDHDDNIKCESLTNESVPDKVQKAFKNKYSLSTPEKWFNKDGKGFTALFSQNGNKLLSQFDNDGTFTSELVAQPKTSEKNHKSKNIGFKEWFGLGHSKKSSKCEDKDDEKETECEIEVTD